jgi:O-antigen/teichoic acid export membrane protein
MSVVTFFVLIVDFGISSLTFRELSKHPDQNEKYFVNGIFLKLILSVVVFVAVYIYTKIDGSITAYSLLIFLFL